MSTMRTPLSPAHPNRPSLQSRFAMETLESRRLLSGESQAAALEVDDTLPGGFAATINFQPASVGVVESTHPDFGRPFGQRGNGLTYGWSRNLEAEGDVVDRDSSRDLAARDERFDTLVETEAGDTWQIEVPDGHYVVGLVAGDPDFAGSRGEARLQWNVNGQPAMQVFPVGDYPWGESVVYVEVTDGLITFESAPEATDNSLLWTRVTQVAPPPSYPQGQGIAWSSSPVEVPTSRIEPGVIQHDNRLYVIGGFTDYYANVARRVDILDLETLEWSQGAPLPASAAETHAGVALDAANGHIYWLGGQLGSDADGATFQTTLDSFRYDIEADTWEQVFDAPVTRFAPGSAVVNGTLHFFGGTDISRIHPTTDHFTIDLNAYNDGEAVDWELAAPMPVASDHFAVERVGDRLYAIGGEYSHTYSYVPIREVQILDTASGTWSTGQAMPQGVGHQEGTTFQHDGRIWVLGGKQVANRGTPAVQSYDPLTDQWATHTSLGLFRFGGIGFARDGRFYYLAGDDFGNQDARGGMVGELV